MSESRINGAQEPAPAPVAQSAPTHLAVPLPVFAKIAKILQALPWEDVNEVMASLNSCSPVTVPTQQAPAMAAVSPPAPPSA